MSEQKAFLEKFHIKNFLRFAECYASANSGLKEQLVMIQISEPITLEKLLPLIQKLPKFERDQLRKSLEEEAQLNAATLLYQEGEVTLDRAAEFAEIHRFEFEEALAARNIWKIVEIDSAEQLKAGVSLIKSLHKSNS